MELMKLTELNSKDRIAEVKSQKAVAIFRHAAAHNSYSVPQNWPAPTSVLIHLSDTRLHLQSAAAIVKYPAFLRACPEFARHGVIESIRCDDESDLMDKFDSLSLVMKEMDPNGCLMLMPFVEAKNSAVMALSHPTDEYVEGVQQWFQGYAIFSEGHDGVTAGHGLQLAFPLRTGNKKDNIILDALQYSPVKHEVEFVFKEGKPRVKDRGVMDSLNGIMTQLTQIRHAPEHTPVLPPPKGVDVIGMIPQGEVVVKEIFVASGLEEVAWLEENITKEKCPDGFVIQELQGSRLSHIYAHCRGEGIPYVIAKVSVGERWVEPAGGWVVIDNDNKFEPQPYSPTVFVDDFRRGVEAGNTYWRKQQGWFSTFFHQWVSLPMSKPQDVAFLAGMFCAWLPKAILALGLGEMRHAKNLKSNANAALFATMTTCVGSDVWQRINETPYLDSSRAHYYAAIGHLKLNWNHCGRLLNFLSKNFSKGWTASYGGKAWQKSMEAGAEVAFALEQFLADSSDASMLSLITAVNSGENCVHNNGFLFNKWLSKAAFTAGTSGFAPREDIDSMSAVYEMAAQFINDVDDTMEAASEPENDWGEILDFVEKRTPAYWRSNLIAKSTKVPKMFRDIMNILPVGWRHGDKGPHNLSSNKTFIMCGVETCPHCVNHITWAEGNKIVMPHLNAIKSLFNIKTASLMIASPKLDVWLVGGLVKIPASVKEQIMLIKAKEFNPTATEFKVIFEALDEHDPDYPEMAMILNKWLSKKDDDMEAFLKELTDGGNTNDKA